MNHEITWKYKFDLTDFGNKENLEKINGDGGIYLWVRKSDGAIWYVGQASNFLSRFEGHFISQIGGDYYLFNLNDDPKRWPSKVKYTPKQENCFEWISDRKKCTERFEDAYTMLEDSFFIFGIMDAEKGIREEAEGEILRFFYDTYYEPGLRPRLLGSVSRNPTGNIFRHIDKNNILKKTSEFYSEYGESFPLKNG